MAVRRRLMVTFAAGLTLASAVAASVGMPDPAAPQNHDPSRARLVTSDIPNFWRVFDRASLTRAADLFQREYLDPGSPGLRDFVSSRIQSSRLLAATVAMRSNTLALDTSATFKDAIHAAFGRLKAFDEEAVFPDVYFVVGRMNSAGTTSSNGLLIGVEMNARDDGTPIDELTAWERAVRAIGDRWPTLRRGNGGFRTSVVRLANPAAALPVIRDWRFASREPPVASR